MILCESLTSRAPIEDSQLVRRHVGPLLTEAAQPHVSGAPSQSRRKEDDELWPIDEESAFVAFQEHEMLSRIAGENMI